MTLNGELEWELQRRAAEQVARRISGVRGSTNLIMDRPRLTSLPTHLKRQIEQALVRSAQTDAVHTTRSRRLAAASFSGDGARSWPEPEEAERIAWSAPGVTEME